MEMEIETKAYKILAARTTRQLINDWEETEKRDKTFELFQVRKWLMNELESRDKTAFDAWLDSNEASPRKSYIAR